MKIEEICIRYYDKYGNDTPVHPECIYCQRRLEIEAAEGERRRASERDLENRYLDYVRKHGKVDTNELHCKVSTVTPSLWHIYDRLVRDGRLIEEKGKYGYSTYVKLGKKVQVDDDPEGYRDRAWSNL